MNTEFEELKDKIRGFLDKQNVETQSQYFLLLSLTEDIKDEIMEDDDDPEDDEEPEEELDEFENLPEEPEPPKKDHKSIVKDMLNKKVLKKPRIKVKNPESDLE